MGKPTQILAHIMSLVPRLVRAEIAKLEPSPGPAGEQGLAGDRGARGQRGDRGYGFASAEIKDGVLHLGMNDDEGSVFAVGNVIGPQGETGARGASGSLGEPGVDGAIGETGSPGLQGEPGIDAIDGIDGVNGINGVDGVNGINGVDGVNASGIDGAPGIDGKDGNNGEDGTDGAQGEAGSQGEIGRGIEKAFVAEGKLVVAFTDGEQMEVGYVVGERGQRGVKGSKGTAGTSGEQGLTGLGVVWLGAYDPKREYHGQFDQDNPTLGQAALVRHDGGVYVAQGKTEGNEPSPASEHWDVFV